MKKMVSFGLCAATLVLSGLLAGQTVNAATATTPDPSSKSVAEFEVKAGGDNGDGNVGTDPDLVLNRVPDLHFKDTTISELINGTSLAYVDGKVKNPVGANGENQDELLEVIDNRGTNAGWKLTAAMTPFVNKAAKGTADLTGSLTFNTTLASAPVPTATVANAQIKTNGEGVTIWNANSFSGEGKNTAKVDGTNTKLALNKNAHATKGTYDATITWTLVGTPDTNK